MNYSNAKKITKKIKTAYQVSTNPELASIVGLTVSAIEQWSKKNKVPEKYIFKCIGETGVSLDWLMDEDNPTFNIEGKGNIGQQNNHRGKVKNFVKEKKSSTKSKKTLEEKELELFEEFQIIEGLANLSKNMDYLKKEMDKIKSKFLDDLSKKLCENY